MFDKVIGSLIVSSWADTALFVIEIIYAFRYLHAFWDDTWYIKATVFLCLAVDALSVAGHYASVYLYCVTHWGNLPLFVCDTRYPSLLQATAYIYYARPMESRSQYWPIFTYVVTTGVSAVVVELYLIYRYWRASRMWSTTALLLSSTMAALIGCIITTAILTKNSNYEDRDDIIIPVTIWLVATAFADVGIATVLILQLMSMHKGTTFTHTKSTIRRLIRDALKTGTLTSIVALAVLITYLTDQESNVTVGIGFCLGRFYTLTLLYNLLSRKAVMAGGRSQRYSTGSVPALTNSMLSSSGIFVQRSQHVMVDEPEKIPRFSVSIPQAPVTVPDLEAAPRQLDAVVETS
ncbi:unnamed protein product [Mycena citricolor]|uniref:DUF6534 domain-containing protein n=1 Tax=Mycena citricolor TaxID=2018698 RepID=A0AAD2H383_9AGAR|nr:unnamed protein product [Mycena citricolor]